MYTMSFFSPINYRNSADPRPSILTVRSSDPTRYASSFLILSLNMSASAFKAGESSKPAEQKTQETLPNLGVLEEDDEFEEFAVAGQLLLGLYDFVSDLLLLFSGFLHTDWNDSETDLAHLGGAQPGAAKSGGDKLWEDNWDDDDIEDEFSVQLR